MLGKKKVSVVFPCYNEEKNIRNAIKEFFSIPEVDEIIVVDNNSTDNSKKEILKTKAKYFLETKQGYGWALRRGLKEAKGDIIITVEPDGTFVAKDIYKFFVYSDEFDVVFGTRTSKSLIWSNANMGWFLRVGNIIVAKILEYLHNGPSLTDVGCTYKLIHKKLYKRIYKYFRVGGSHFSPELMILSLKKGKCVEIPINYKGRIGSSKITGKFFNALRLGLKMIWLIIEYKIFPYTIREKRNQKY